MKFCELEVVEFEKFVLGAPGANFMQSREMYERLKRSGREVYLLGVKQGSEIVCGGIAMKMGEKLKQKIFGIAMGPLVKEETEEIFRIFTEGMSDFLRRKGGMAVQISPHIVVNRRNYEDEIVEEVNPEIKKTLQGLGYKDLGEVGQIKWEYVITLQGKTEEEIFNSFRKDVRTRIKQATLRYGVRIRDLGYDELSVMKEMADEAVAAHGFRDRDLEYYQSMYEAFADKVKFVVAEAPKEVAEGQIKRIDEGDVKLSGKMVPISAVMYMLYGGEVLSLFSGVTRKYKNVGGCSHLIRWELIKYALENGYERYDFYGVRPEKGNSVYNFKAGFRGEIEELVGTQMLPLSKMGKIYTKRAKYYEYGDFS